MKEKMEEKLIKINKINEIKNKNGNNQMDLSFGGLMKISKITFLNNRCSTVNITIKTDSGWKLAKKYSFTKTGMAFNLKQIIVSLVLSSLVLYMYFRNLIIR